MMKSFEIFKIPVKSKGQIYVFPGPFKHRVEKFAVKQLKEARIQLVINLTTKDEWLTAHGAQQESVYTYNNIDYIHYPIQDYGVPHDPESFTALVAEINSYLWNGKHVGIHCIGGIGRSGLTTAALLCKQGMAINEVFNYMSTYRGRNMPDTQQQISWFKEYVHSLNSK